MRISQMNHVAEKLSVMTHVVEELGACQNSSGKQIRVVEVRANEPSQVDDTTSWMLNTIFSLGTRDPDVSRAQGTIRNPRQENLPWLFEYQRGADQYSSQMRVVGMDKTYMVSPVKATELEHAFGFGDRSQSSSVLVPVWLEGKIQWTTSEATSVQRTRYRTSVFYVKDIRREIISRDLSKELQDLANDIFKEWVEKRITISPILTESESNDVGSILYGLELLKQGQAINESRFFSALSRFVSDPMVVLEKHKTIVHFQSAASHYVNWRQMAALWGKKRNRL